MRYTVTQKTSIRLTWNSDGTYIEVRPNGVSGNTTIGMYTAAGTELGSITFMNDVLLDVTRMLERYTNSVKD